MSNTERHQQFESLVRLQIAASELLQALDAVAKSVFRLRQAAGNAADELQSAQMVDDRSDALQEAYRASRLRALENKE